LRLRTKGAKGGIDKISNFLMEEIITRYLLSIQLGEEKCYG